MSEHIKPASEGALTPEPAPMMDPASEGQENDLEDWIREISSDEGGHAYRAATSTGMGPSRQAEFGAVASGRDGWLIKETTAQTYHLRAVRLWRAAAERKARLNGDLEAPALIKPMDVVDYLNWRRLPQPGLPAISESTWYSYRSALLWDFSRTQQADFILACKELESLTEKAKHDPVIAQSTAKRARKGGIKAADLKRLIDQLGTMNRKMGWGRRTQYWLQAGIATGLRPGEWEFARWADEQQNLLIAPTTKVKASPAAYARPRWSGQAPAGQEDGAAELPFGERPSRPEPPAHLPLRAIPVEPIDRLFVAEHLSSIQQAAEMGCPFAMYQEYCRQTLWRACRQLWGGTKRYALYQARHQFSANSRGRLSPDELAAAMGHTRRSTTARHYADSHQAHRKSGGVKMQMGQRGQSGQMPPPQAPTPGGPVPPQHADPSSNTGPGEQSAEQGSNAFQNS